MAPRGHRRRDVVALARRGSALAIRGVAIGAVATGLGWLVAVLFGTLWVVAGAILLAGIAGHRRYGWGRPGSSARRHGDVLVLEGLGLGLAAVTFVYLALAVAHGVVWRGLSVVAAFVAVANGWELFQRSAPWREGAAGERCVAKALEPLKDQGWRIEHDVMKRQGGNVDHVAHAPTGEVFTVETKLHGIGALQLEQARRHGAWAARRYGAPAVPVLCVANRPQRPRVEAGVWCMDAEHLRGFLEQAARRDLS